MPTDIHMAPTLMLVGKQPEITQSLMLLKILQLTS